MKDQITKDGFSRNAILVLAEDRNGALLPSSFELVSEARRLADALGSRVTALLIGSGVAPLARELGGYGADEILVYDHPFLRDYTTEAYTAAVADAVRETVPEALLIAATCRGRDLAPRCAARLGTGLCADVMRIDVSQAAYEDYLRTVSSLSEEAIRNTDSFDVLGTRVSVTHDLKMTLPAFGGSLMTTIVCPRFRPVMATVRPGVLEKAVFDEKAAERATITIRPLPVSPAFGRMEVLETIRFEESATDLAKADAVVAIGRGIAKDPARGVALAEELAEVLGGLVGGTRVAIEKGWIAPDRQIGQTGKTVRPKLLVTLGISGAAQFTIGVPSADCIIAVNKDKNAPVFGFADYGIAGDIFRVVPEMIRAFRCAKENR